MPVDPGPHPIESIRPIMAPNGGVTLHPVTPDFYEKLDDVFETFAGHVLIQTATFDAPWGVWEMHPKGDEFVYVISGDVDFLVKPPGAEPIRLRIHEPGSYVVVPKGHWHTAIPNAPTTMLFVTPGEGTLNEPEPLD